MLTTVTETIKLVSDMTLRKPQYLLNKVCINFIITIFYCQVGKQVK